MTGNPHKEHRPRPVLNGCYLDETTDMIKVRLLAYSGGRLDKVLVEDTQGRFRKLDIEDWNRLRLIPCCQSGY